MHLVAAIKAFFRVLSEGDSPAVAPAPVAAPEPPRPVFTTSPAPAVQLLGLLQREGRLVDFLMEDISSFADADVGAAVRDIHRGCRTVIQKHVKLRRALPEAEGSTVSVPVGFDPSLIELQGAVSGQGPFRGELLHPGWYAEEVKLPTIAPAADPNVVAAAQVEVKP